MPVIINEVDVIAPPPSREVLAETSGGTPQPPGLTPHDIYWITRKLLERQMRLTAR